MSPRPEVITTKGSNQLPSALRLAWLLFMQPVRLRRLLELLEVDLGSSVWRLRGRIRQGDPAARWFLLRLGLFLLIGNPGLILVAGAIAQAVGRRVEWQLLAAWIGLLLATQLLFSLFRFMAWAYWTFSMTLMVTIFVLTDGASYDTDIGRGILFGLTIGASIGSCSAADWILSNQSEKGNIFLGVFIGVGTPLMYNVAFPATVGLTFSTIIIVSFLLLHYRFASYPLEATLSWVLSELARTRNPATLAHWLPHRWHDLIRLPLPGLSAFIVKAGEQDVLLGQELIAEAAASLGQKRPAREARAELEKRDLVLALRRRQFIQVRDLTLPFLPRRAEVEEDPNLFPFVGASEDLLAAQTTLSQFHRRRSLQRAADGFRRLQLAVAAAPNPQLELLQRSEAARIWLHYVRGELAKLEREAAVRPQVPTPFVVGAALGAGDGSLFKGRHDLIRIIDHDLTGDRRAPILVSGQRRLGKSSLLNMLPNLLGSGTRVVKLNFQGLSGQPDRERPYLWIPRAVAKACGDVPTFSAGNHWGVVLEWLERLESRLEEDDRRLLIALDEVERLQDGIDDGWTNSDLLDLIRAAGDSLHRVRMLLLSAYPLERLGPHWVDRLISVLPRELSYLGEDDAEALVRSPTDGFPDIYPPAGVERVLEETNRHPYLIQYVCDQLTKRLNDKGRLHADDDDLQAAFDLTLETTPLFLELWRERTDEERAILQSLATGLEPPDETASALRQLERQGYLTQREGRSSISVPLFSAWVEDRFA